MATVDALRSIDGHRRFTTETDLNRATSAAYNACRGNHVRSGDSVKRDFGNQQRELPICANCGCPFGGPRHVKPQVRWNGTRA